MDEAVAVRAALAAVAAGRTLSADEARAAFDDLMRGSVPPVLAGALLLALRARGETATEVAGVAAALRGTMVAVAPPAGTTAIDTCGTGGGAVGTFNVSTAAGLVAAAAGATVAKHGNRSYTSRCGSADVLEALGVTIATDAARASRQFAAAGMAFLYAPAFHPAMRHLAPVRKELGVATIMNLVGPLANPARVRRQVVGVGDADRAPLVADALALLDTEHALVVHAEIGMDEIAPHGRTTVWEVRDGAVRRWSLDPADLGLAQDDVAGLAGGDPAANAERVRLLLTRPGADPAGRAAVVLNAGAAIYVAGLAPDIGAGVARAAAALDGGAAAAALERLVGA